MMNEKTVLDYKGTAFGRVVETNDPQQMGRLRILCPTLGDNPEETNLNKIPWSTYISPFGGSITTEEFTRGPNEDKTIGHVAYGMWNIPKIGAIALVLCVDQNPNERVWLGCSFGQNLNNTLPHGRFFTTGASDLENDGELPAGPYSTSEEPINPLNDNLREAFNPTPDNYEWRTRAADYTVGGAHNDMLIDVEDSFAPDEIQDLGGAYEESTGKKKVTQGYARSRIDPDKESPILYDGKNYDSQTYSWTTPGFHSISMDDRKENGRMRFRTTTGHQILLDDTNERIYISTSKGKNWIEMDSEGNVEIFTENKVNIRAESDINFTSDKSIRMHAKKGIHMYSGEEIRMHAQKDIHVRTEQNFRMKSKQQMFLEADEHFNVYTSQEFRAYSSQQMNLKSDMNITQTGLAIHMNGPEATKSPNAAEIKALWSNRVPAHEPWPRTMTKNDYTHEPQFTNDDPKVGQAERDGTTETTIIRGNNWRR